MARVEPDLPPDWGKIKGEEHPDSVIARVNYNRGIQDAWHVAMSMANSLPATPVTYGAKVMRDAAMDIADAILDLKQQKPGDDPLKECRSR